MCTLLSSFTICHTNRYDQLIHRCTSETSHPTLHNLIEAAYSGVIVCTSIVIYFRIPSLRIESNNRTVADFGALAIRPFFALKHC